MLAGVTVVGDFIRSDAQGRPGEGDRSVVWLCNAIKRQIGRAGGLPVTHLTAHDCREIAACIETARPPEEADAFWAAAFDELPIDPALEHILMPLLERQFVVGKELPPYLIRLLEQWCVPWLDTRIHPIRFLDDLLFAVRASDGGTHQSLFGMAVHEDIVIAEAGLLEAMCRYTTESTLPTGALLVIGQRTMDSTQIIGGRFFNALDDAAKVLAICTEHPVAVLKPHPYGGQHSLLLAAAAASNAVVTNDNLYRMLALPQIDTVLTVNSSAAYEARYFDKRIVTLAPLPVRIGWRGEQCEPDTYASMDQQVLCSDFWRAVLAPFAPVSACDGARLPAKPNRLRIAFDSFWNFQQVDTDRVPRSGQQ